MTVPGVADRLRAAIGVPRMPDACAGCFIPTFPTGAVRAPPCHPVQHAWQPGGRAAAVAVFRGAAQRGTSAWNTIGAEPINVGRQHRARNDKPRGRLALARGAALMRRTLAEARGAARLSVRWTLQISAISPK